MLANVLLDLLMHWDFTSLGYVHFCTGSVKWTGWSDLTWWRWHGVVVAVPQTAHTKRLCLNCRTDLPCEKAVRISGAGRNKAGELPAPLLRRLSKPACWAAPDLPGKAQFVPQLAPTPSLAKAIYYIEDCSWSCTSSPMTLININNCKDHSESLAVYLPNPT